MKRNKKRVLITILIVVACVAAVLAGAAILTDPYRGTAKRDNLKEALPVSQVMTRETALEDLAYLSGQIEAKHLSALHGLPAAVQKQYEQEIAGLPAQPTVLDVWTASSRILKQLNDAHSSAGFHSSAQSQKRLDARFLKTDTGVFCITEPNVGWQLTKANGVDMDTLYQRFLAMYSYENINWADRNFTTYLRTSQGLGWLGVEASETVQLTFDNGGKAETLTLPFVEPPASAEAPPFVRYEIDAQRGVGILTLDECTLNQTYRDTVKKFFTEVKAAGVRAVAVDLRANGGGNSGVVGEFLRYLPVDSYRDYGGLMRRGPLVLGGGPSDVKNSKYSDLAFGCDVYVLTGRGTFSSAMWFAVMLRDNDLAKVVGQAPGNKPSAYGDVLLFQMPRSRLIFALTYKQFTRPDTSKNNEDTLNPDYPTPLTTQSDGAMEKLYELVGQK